jgi:uncharacterized membrane protein YkvA (DUF1232 family)
MRERADVLTDRPDLAKPRPGDHIIRMTGRELTLNELEKLKRDRRRTEQGFWRKLRHHAGRIPFVGDLLAAFYCAVDPATPLKARAVLYGALAYFILPVDIMPDWIVGLGFTDDAAVLAAAVRSILPHIKDQHRDAARATIDRLANPQ